MCYIYIMYVIIITSYIVPLNILHQKSIVIIWGFFQSIKAALTSYNIHQITIMSSLSNAFDNSFVAARFS